MSDKFEDYSRELNDVKVNQNPVDVHIMKEELYEYTSILKSLDALEEPLDCDLQDLIKYEQWLEDQK